MVICNYIYRECPIVRLVLFGGSRDITVLPISSYVTPWKTNVGRKGKNLVMNTEVAYIGLQDAKRCKINNKALKKTARLPQNLQKDN